MNIVELRNDLALVYAGVRDKSLNNDDAKTASSVAGKIIATAKIQIEYNKMVKFATQIPFLDTRLFENEKV